MSHRYASLSRRLIGVVLVVVLSAACSDRLPTAISLQVPVAGGTSTPSLPHECVFQICRGTTGDSEYRILMPARWNGTLLLFAPGFIKVFSTPRTGRPIALGPAPPTLTQWMLDRGYGLAGATYAWGGWSVASTVTAAEVAYAEVTARFGPPRRVYAWGESMGGLASVMLAERHPDWVTGAASACGVLGGTARFFDLALDAAYAMRTLMVPALRISGFTSYKQAAAAFGLARRTVRQATTGTLAQRAQLLLVASLIGAPSISGQWLGQDRAARVAAAARAIDSALSFGTYARWDLEREHGGPFSSNVGVDYAARLDGAQRAEVDAVAPGTVLAALRALAAGTRVSANPAARARVTSQLGPTGLIRRPVVTLHTADDPAVPVEHEGVYAAEVAGNGAAGLLLPLVTVPPLSWSGQRPPYGAGHCRFTEEELAGMLTVLDRWVGTGVRPDRETILAAFGSDTGLDLGYRLPPWPGSR
ncbi:MAG TPA: hypothetical protein VLJ59_13115 [Mycobacteriales bacterium]|nr:hypothetical protein [Mycobacteriales bacterium]